MPRGRKNQGKTATIKERTVTVYVPDIETLELWKKKAGNMSLSKFVVKTVNDSISGRGVSREMVKEMELRTSKLEAECKRLREREAELLSKLDAIYKELKLCVAKGAAENREFDPYEINRALVEALKSGKKTEEELLEIMGASDNPEALRALSRQLAALMDFGFVEFDGRHWCWIL